MDNTPRGRENVVETNFKPFGEMLENLGYEWSVAIDKLVDGGDDIVGIRSRNHFD